MVLTLPAQPSVMRYLLATMVRVTVSLAFAMVLSALLDAILTVVKVGAIVSIVTAVSSVADVCSSTRKGI